MKNFKEIANISYKIYYTIARYIFIIISTLVMVYSFADALLLKSTSSPSYGADATHWQYINIAYFKAYAFIMLFISLPTFIIMVSPAKNRPVIFWGTLAIGIEILAFMNIHYSYNCPPEWLQSIANLFL